MLRGKRDKEKAAAEPKEPRMSFVSMWDQLVDCICRPPRDEYPAEELVGGSKGHFLLSGYSCSREDFTLVNKTGLKLECSEFKPERVAMVGHSSTPVVIYCHCNSGSRRDAEEAIQILLPHGICVVALDFAGSGRSEGNWVTLGAREVDDLEILVEHVRHRHPESIVGLWGRSMGAVTALLYGQRDPSIAGMVLDSPFSRLKDLMVELTEEQKLPIPRPFMRMALSMMKRSVKKRANFNIDDVAPLDVVGRSFIPALFGHAENDSFISTKHSQRLHDAYAGDKNFITFEGDHNTHRPQFFYASVLIFLNNVLQISKELPSPVADATLAAGDGLPSASDAHAARGEELVERTLSVPWLTGPAWAGTAEELEEAWAAEVSRGLLEGDVRLADANPGIGRGWAPDGRQRSASEPTDGASAAASAQTNGPVHTPARTASAGSELPVSVDSEVKTLEQQQAEEEAARLAEEEAARVAEEQASRRARWQIMQEDEAELLSQALQLSLVEDKPRRHLPPSAAASGSAAVRRDYIPQSVAAMSAEDADEAMLVAAIQASLVDAGEGGNAPSSQPPAKPEKEPTSAREDTPGASASLIKDLPQVSKENSEFVQQVLKQIQNDPVKVNGDESGASICDDKAEAQDSASEKSPEREGHGLAGNGSVADVPICPSNKPRSYLCSVTSSEHSCTSTPAVTQSEPCTKDKSEDHEVPVLHSRHKQQDPFERAADAAARGDYSAAAAGRFDE